MQNENFNKPSIDVKPIKTREYSIMIFKDNENRLLVRKSVLMSGIKVPLFETYARGLIHAYQIQQDIINELNGFRLN